ncbi:nestin [Archocentrus centrarchus]|uniref:nestin n=1 Tax=Archocentrus centrarchus TaxID=63155 RepID=UPI0011EA3C0F|nr:nestin-like [Archocentrus centrarchus]
MELHSLHRIFHPNHLGEEKQQMLNLNRRLETYLNRVKLLEEENALLAKEIQVIRHNNQGALTHKKGLEEELRQARLEVDAVWRDRVLTEVEVGKLTEELQALDLQRQREAEAQVKARTKLEQSRRELEEEQRAQIWLREKVNQLEYEMRLLIQTHEEDVAHLEAKLTNSRATLSHAFAQKGNQTPNLLQLGHEYSQSATRAWQEAAEAYQGQLARLEESLNQARSRLTQVGQEKRESQLKLQTLEKEIVSAQEIRQHLEKTVAQQTCKHSQEIQQLQEHLEALEVEKQELGHQIDHIVMENRGLLQLKMSLGLEVATYRALLDSESLKGDVSLLNQPRSISITDTVFSPRGVKKNYQTQLSASRKTTSLSSVRSIPEPTVMSASPPLNRNPVTSYEMQKISGKSADTDATKAATWETPYPKILHDGAVENFRPQEVSEKVTYAEPLSPPNEPEAIAKTPSGEDEEDWNNGDVECSDERPVVESVVSCQPESALSTGQSFNDEDGNNQFATPSHTLDHANVTGAPCSLPGESVEDVALEEDAGKEEMQQPPAPLDAWVMEECINKDIDHFQEESSESETEAVLEPTSESRPSSPESECEPAESVFNQMVNENLDENPSNDGDPTDIKQEKSSSMVGINQMDVEDKLYPDGEEMDTWDSVIERKIDVKRDDGITNDGRKGQHAEPEEDISAREAVNEQRGGIRKDFATVEQQDNIVTSSLVDTQADNKEHVALEQELALPPNNEEEDDKEDSQNVSMSWRTELEGDSYAQDNTLADTRPLIRYKSDETDANTQVSHMDESESSEGEQEKKTGETGTGTWSESKSKKFGTMEDLCEEVEGETMDDEYNLGYTHIKDGDIDDTTVNENATQVNDKESAKEMIGDSSEGHSDEETEELMEDTVCTNADHDEELETDKLVEQELENLCTDSYNAHFAQQQVSEQLLHPNDKTVQEMTEEEENISACEPGLTVNHELATSTTIINQTSENLSFRESSVVMPQIDTVAIEEIQCEAQETKDTPEKREEENEPSVSMVARADVTEDQSGFNDFMNRLETEESNDSEDSNSVLLVTADEMKNVEDMTAPTEEKEASPLEATSHPQEHLDENVEECQELPEAEWEVLENPREDFKIRAQIEHDEKSEKVPESTNEGSITHQEESLEIPPERTPDENAFFKVKDATNNGLNDFFSSGVKNDFWVSSLESGATCEPDDACNENDEQINENLGFADNLVWKITENQNVFNGKSKVDTDSSKTLTLKNEQEQMHREVKEVLSRNASEGELVHSEESEVEAELWSSGEEPA